MPKPETFIKVIEHAISDELCDQFVTQFELSKNTQPGRTGGGVDPDKKRSRDVSIITHPEFKTPYQALLPVLSQQILAYFENYFFALIGPIGLTVKHPKSGQPVKLTQDNFKEVGLPNLANLMGYLFRLGNINAQIYDKQQGGYPYWHSEVYPQANSTDALHRILLFMFYLNDVEEGGETEFYYQDLSIKPRKGTMVIAPAYFTHTHRGNVPISNDKYILTSWVQFNQANVIFGQPTR
ncbi:2OG-Fe(II) oxygenase [Paraglaciecola chathamensis]|uniref:2OG-Fe(II) oxygenase n=1 Tax=Paraglaciecola chathamensis TaxID=368405 RepID=A0ABS0WE09_9ALTE|nr:2OG-Fe(II) oxygenase [Paraglaciecola chathamensis]MBJ2136731.1 2OG-Fe(II) oxygenase [Paraglaciecola chathamensis]